ncbi:MAG: hypothetical protein IMY72_10175 [Bacteroidetes bacterium]|nr:hypothetical protein [Bacteroidota bacterium]
MDFKRIENLLNKYFEAETSIAEENELRIFFSNNKDIPENLIFAKSIFKAFNEEKSIKFHKKIHLPKRNIKRYIYITGIAASLIISMFVIFPKMDTKRNKIIYAYYNGQAITDKAIAEKYTKQALFAVAQNFNNGTKNLNKLSQFNKSELLIKTKENEK